MSQFSVSAWAASSEQTGYEAHRAGDGLVGAASGTRWGSASAVPQWLRADLGTAKVVEWYDIAPGKFSTNQEPAAWTFEGSNDASSWTTLDTRTAQTFTTGKARSFTFTNATAYRYYRLSITDVLGNEFEVASVGELRLGSGTPVSRLWSDQNYAAVVTGSYTLGVVFRPDANGYITALSYLKSSATGTVTLYLYDTARTVLASVTFDPTSTPTQTWVEVPITPVAVTSGTNYMVAAYIPTNASNVSGSLASAQVHGDLTILANGSATFDTRTTNPRFGTGTAFPTSTGGANYAVSAVFSRDVPSSGITGSVAGAGPAAVGSLVGVVPTSGSLAGSAPAASGALVGTAPTTGALAGVGPLGEGSLVGATDNTIVGTVQGSAPAGVGSLAGTAPTVGAVAGVAPVPVGSLSGVVAGGSTDALAGVAPMGVGALVGDTGTSLDPWSSGAHGDALVFLDAPAGVLEVTYPAAVAPPAIVEVSLQRASHQMPALTGVRAMDYPIETDVIGTPHVWVDGVDVTYFRDVPTKIAGWRQEAPFGWTSTTLTFPQVFHYEERGVGDLAWMRADARVEIAIVTPLGERLHKFTGQLTSDDPGVGRGRTECTWGVEGVLWQADHAHHPVPARLDPTDIRTLIVGELMGTPSRRFTVSGPATGILERKRGSNNMTRWGYTSDLLAVAIREDGKQWTIQPTGKASFALALKDTTTVHWTVTAGAPGVELDLSHDHHERIDAVYASGVGPDGYAWWNNFYPDLLPYDPPDYPYANPAQNVVLGSTDAGTLTGTGVSDWQRRIRDLGYTNLAVDGVMGSADIAAVRWIQRKRGIQVDGFLGPQTWAATWNVGAVGGDLTVVRLPMAVRPEVEKYLYGANGATVGLNPDYDPSIIRHEIDVDFGAGVTKAQGREMALRILERGMDPGVAGTIKLTTCPWEGSRWEINAGDNLLLKGFRGEDILMRVAALDADPESLTVSLTVDSEFRDAMAVMQVLDRNRESKADPARRPGNPNRRSRLDQDQVTPFEGESPAGRLPKMALYGGLWTVWPVPVSEVGLIAKLRFLTTGPASRFAMALFGKPVTANQVEAKVPDPLAASNPWEAAGDAWLNSVGFIEGWGEQGQAAGYGMLGSESDGSPVTGELYDDAGVPYVSQVAPWVWVAMYAPNSCFIEGRIYPDPVQ